MNDIQPSRDSPPSYPNHVQRRSSVASFSDAYSDRENDFLLALAQEVLDDSSADEDDSWSMTDTSDCTFSFEDDAETFLIECPTPPSKAPPSKQVSFGHVTVYDTLRARAPGADDSSETKLNTSTTSISLVQHEIARLMRSPSSPPPRRKRHDKSSSSPPPPCKGWTMSKQQHDQLFARCEAPPIEAGSISTRKKDGIAHRGFPGKGMAKAA